MIIIQLYFESGSSDNITFFFLFFLRCYYIIPILKASGNIQTKRGNHRKVQQYCDVYNRKNCIDIRRRSRCKITAAFIIPGTINDTLAHCTFRHKHMKKLCTEFSQFEQSRRAQIEAKQDNKAKVIILFA